MVGAQPSEAGAQEQAAMRAQLRVASVDHVLLHGRLLVAFAQG